MSIKPGDTSSVVYYPPKTRYAKMPTESIEPIGIDSEADIDGRMFMICTELGDVWTPEQWPNCLFSRKYRGKVFVAYNLKYDSGAMFQHLPMGVLDILRVNNTVYHEGYRYKVIANKYVSISKGKNASVIYDIYQYYHGSLDYNAKKYLGEEKDDIETKRFTRLYYEANWNRISAYCIKDCELTGRLARRLVKQLNDWGMHVRKLYSTAHVSYTWFAAKCGHPSVETFWRYDRRILDFAMASYNGGKFEVTTKGSGYFYEYDIVSAYPSTIATLLDLHQTSVAWTKVYQREAAYAFINCTIKIPPLLPSPVAIKRGGKNVYPVGEISKVITKVEYDYLINNGADITIHDACWIIPDKIKYLYKEEIERLVQLKQEYKNGDQMAYHTIKILLNSLYGKFVQLIEMDDSKWRAGSSWNPIYGSVITANTRVRISNLQRQHPSIWAVHTDSIISDQPLPYVKSSLLGDLSYEIEGPGILVGCGVYEIAGKSALRGIPSAISLAELSEKGGAYADVSSQQPLSWRMALMRNFDNDQINRWMDQQKHLRPAMDDKRIWIDDWTDWREVTQRRVESVPWVQF